MGKGMAFGMYLPFKNPLRALQDFSLRAVNWLSQLITVLGCVFSEPHTQALTKNLINAKTRQRHQRGVVLSTICLICYITGIYI